MSVSMWTLYVENHVWGHGEVRTKHVMSNGAHTWQGCPKVNPQPNTSLPHPTAQHFVTFGVPQPQIINHHLDEYMGLLALFSQNPYTNYGGTAVAISTCEPESMTRHQSMGNAEQHAEEKQQEHVF